MAVGGGGLIAGIAAWYEGRIKVVGVEPDLAPTLTRALAAGRPVDAEAGGIAADLRCVTQPHSVQAALFDRLGIALPKRMRLAEAEIPDIAIST